MCINIWLTLISNLSHNHDTSNHNIKKHHKLVYKKIHVFRVFIYT